MLNIEPQKVDFMNCNEGLITAYASWLKIDYELMFAESWGFNYESIKGEQRELIGEVISTHKEISWKFLDSCHGIKSKNLSFQTPVELLPIIKKQLNSGYPTIIFISNYWYPWDSGYKKYNNGLYHGIMITGISEKERCLYCTDSTFMKYNVTLPLLDFIKGSDSTCIALSYDNNANKTLDWKMVLKESILKFKKKENIGLVEFVEFDNIRRFAEDVLLYLDIEKELHDHKDNIWAAPIIFKIGEIINGRINYARLLDYISKEVGIVKLAELSDMMKEVGVLWESIRGMIIKGYYTNGARSINERIANKIKKTADLEEHIATDIFELTNSSQGKMKLEKPINTVNVTYGKFSEIEYLELDKYANNKTFGDPLNSECSGNMSGIGYFMYIDALSKERVWEAENMRFLFPDVTAINDSIVCDGQTIELPRGSYYSLMLLGCADFGSFSEEMYVDYEDLQEQKLTLQFSNHAGSKIIYGETVMWKGKCGFFNKEDESFESRIFGKTYFLEADKRVKGLRLPVCSNMIIFAISLAKI